MNVQPGSVKKLAPPASLMCCLLVLSGCMSQTLQSIARETNWVLETRQTDRFLHRTLAKPGTGTLLHVYIEGDGRPWRGRSTVAADPSSPGALLMPRLMQQDASQALFIGRPCYFQTSDPACSAIWWTHQRYAANIVASMNTVLTAANTEKKKIVLIGHSGGGTLAWLMAAQRNDVVAVITMAANLDIRAWAEHHGYSPLNGSLNPADLPDLGEQVLQRHYLGNQDKVVTARMLKGFLQRHPNAVLKTIDDADHRCCWETDWSERLKGNLQSITATDT